MQAPEPSSTPHKESSMDRRAFCLLIGGAVAGASSVDSLIAEDSRDGVLYPVRVPTPKTRTEFSWYDTVLATIPPLKNPRGARWPLIAWEGFSFQPQPPGYYHELLRRGLAQHIRLEAGMIATAPAC